MLRVVLAVVVFSLARSYLAMSLQFLDGASDGSRIAYRYSPCPTSSVVVVFCGGFGSDMDGVKATHLEGHCVSRGTSFLRFDYRGHGIDRSKFEEFVLSDWIQDAERVLERVLVEHDRILLVGSSMGAWISLCIMGRPSSVAGLVGIAAAPDFLQRMRFDSSLELCGRVTVPSKYGDNFIITKRLLEDAEKWTLLSEPQGKGLLSRIRAPMRLLHGMEDEDVPFRVSMEVSELVSSDDVVVQLIKRGDHRLSSPSDLRRICRAVDEMLEIVG